MAPLFAKLNEILLDQNSKTVSYGKAVSLPFLISAWLIGTAYGVKLVVNHVGHGAEITDWLWTMAGISMVLYGTYQTGRVIIKRGDNGKVVVPGTKDETDSGDTPQ